MLCSGFPQIDCFQSSFSGLKNTIFSVALESNYFGFWDVNGVIPWDVAINDPGHNFDVKSHTYSAPANGYYLFTLRMFFYMFTPSSSDIEYGKLYVDGKSVFVCGTGNICTFSVELTKGQKVQTKARAKLTPAASRFTGHLLYPV